MTIQIPAEVALDVVGVDRHPIEHWGKAVSAERLLYILHSESCVEARDDLTECIYSKALDNGIDLERWQGHFDKAALLVIEDWRLVPHPTLWSESA